MAHISLLTCTTRATFIDLNREFRTNKWQVISSDHACVCGLKHVGNFGKKTVIGVALAIVAIVSPLLFLLEITIRAIDQVILKARLAKVQDPLPAPTESMISYTFSGGRFGDCCLTYLHAKWLSYKYGIPLCFQKFEFSDRLSMHDIEKEFSIQKFRAHKKYGEEKPFTRLARMTPDERKAHLTLYSLYYYPESSSERGPNYRGAYVDVDWNDPGFKQEILKVMQPREPLTLVQPPKDRLSVAIHWRRGSGTDIASTRNMYPCKLPSDEFYLEQVVRLVKMYPGRPLYVHLFTDDKNPVILQDKIREAIDKAEIHTDIVFGTADEERDPDKVVLEDFFSMAKFDCMIRAESAYSILAQIIGNHELVISPSRFYTEMDWRNNRGDLIIDEITVHQQGKEKKEKAQIRFPFIVTQETPLSDYTNHHRECFGLA